jgi:hypothetical protein
VKPRLFQGLTRSAFLGQAPDLGHLLQKLFLLVGAVVVNHPLDAREAFLHIRRIGRHHSISVAPAGSSNCPRLHNAAGRAVCITEQTFFSNSERIVLRPGHRPVVARNICS